MTEWEPIFFGCPDLIEYHWYSSNSLIPALDPYCRQSHITPEYQTKWIVGEKDGRVFFGRRGKVGDVLGWKDKAARDNGGEGRPMAFFLGYSAPAGAPLPCVEDFDRIKDEILKKDLDDLCRKFSRPSSDQPVIEPVSFDFPAVKDREISEHPWNTLVSEIERGRKSTLLVINQQGKIETKDFPLSHVSSIYSPEDETEQKKKRARVQYPASFQIHPSNLLTILAIVVVIIVLLLMVKLFA
jgi:hypothetical protein